MEGGRQNYISASWHIATKAATVVVLLLSLVGSNAFDIKSTLLCFSPPPQMAEWSEHISNIAISSLPHNNTAHFSYTAVQWPVLPWLAHFTLWSFFTQVLK